MGSPLLEVRGLRSEGRFRDQSFDLRGGERVVLSGPSGSGKSSLLRALADLDPVTAGDVRLRGIASSETPARVWRSEVLYVRAETQTLGETVGEDLELAWSLQPRTNTAAPGAHGTGFPGLERSRKTAHLSTGETGLLALERALGLAPSILLLDECTSGMDPDLARKVETFLTGWLNEGRAILWISHDERLADRLGARRLLFP